MDRRGCGCSRLFTSLALGGLLVSSPVTGALEPGAWIVDIGVTIGTKGFGPVLAVKYAVSETADLEAFGSIFLPAMDSLMSPIVGVGAEINAYPRALTDFVYGTLGMSLLFGRGPPARGEEYGAGVSATLWAANAGTGINTGPIPDFHSSGAPARLYAEMGLAWIVANTDPAGPGAGKGPADGIDDGDQAARGRAFLWLGRGLSFPNLEVGVRSVAADP